MAIITSLGAALDIKVLFTEEAGEGAGAAAGYLTAGAGVEGEVAGVAVS